ncbi:MAG: hypothetical protein EPO68_10185 [Planctomycetota bacterium]|nr:MAG: hypothetical protein EPO68_10185 [Planctomycetota bacterium]
MKHAFLALVPLLCAACVSDRVGQARAAVEPADFARLRALQGTWKGTASSTKGETFPVDVDYRLTGGGSAVVETLFRGTQHEMVTVYHCDGRDIVLTHYCAAGNQPRMRLATPGEKELVFEFDGGTNFDPKKDGHMHVGRLEIVDADHVRTRWSYYSGGKLDHDAQFDIARVAASPLDKVDVKAAELERLKALGYAGK